MSGDQFDYSSERVRHENFVGRTELLARLDQLLVDDAADRMTRRRSGPPEIRWRRSFRTRDLWPADPAFKLFTADLEALGMRLRRGHDLRLLSDN